MKQTRRERRRAKRMIEPLLFTLRGEPSAWARPRAFTRGKFVRFFTKAETRKASDSMQVQLISQLPKGFVLLTCAVMIEARFFRTRPKTAPKRIKYPATRPDLDNYLKLVLDNLNSIVLKDDSQVIHIETSKEFATDAQPPGAIITIREASL